MMWLGKKVSRTVFAADGTVRTDSDEVHTLSNEVLHLFGGITSELHRRRWTSSIDLTPEISASDCDTQVLDFCQCSHNET